jgi:chemotaxis protein CheD
MTISVRVSDAKISTDPDSVIVTHALGSCIGVAVYDPVKVIGGLLHFQLPQSNKQDASAQETPFKFADTGFTALLEKLESLGAKKNRVIVKIAGGAKRLSSKTDSFNIGNNNYIAIRKVLWKKGLLIQSQDVGGEIPRTMYFDISNGIVTIKSHGKIIKIL